MIIRSFHDFVNGRFDDGIYESIIVFHLLFICLVFTCTILNSPYTQSQTQYHAKSHAKFIPDAGPISNTTTRIVAPNLIFEKIFEQEKKIGVPGWVDIASGLICRPRIC